MLLLLLSLLSLSLFLRQLFSERWRIVPSGFGQSVSQSVSQQAACVRFFFFCKVKQLLPSTHIRCNMLSNRYHYGSRTHGQTDRQSNSREDVTAGRAACWGFALKLKHTVQYSVARKTSTIHCYASKVWFWFNSTKLSNKLWYLAEGKNTIENTSGRIKIANS